MLRGAVLILTLAVPAPAATIERPPASLPTVNQLSPQDLVREMEAVVAAERGLQPLAARDLDVRLEGYGPRFEALGTRAVPLLSWYVLQKGRPLKIRLYAAAFLGLIGDPEAFPALRRAADDAAADPGLRSAAVQALGSLRLPPPDLRPALDALLGPAVPPAVRREAVVQLSAVGTDRPLRLAAVARALGRAPRAGESAEAQAAAQALGASPAASADGALVGLVAFEAPGTAAREAALTALERRRAAWPSWRPTRRQLDVLLDVPFEERGSAALTATRLLGLLGDRRAVEPLTRLLRAAPDAALAAEAAAALAAIGDRAAAPAVAALAARLNDDPRFGARPGQPESGAFARRIEEAARTLGGVRPAAPKTAPAPFSYEGWPGEQTPVVVSAGGALRLRSAPSDGAPVAATVTVPGGQRLPLGDSLVVSTRSGWARVRRAGILRALDFGAVRPLTAAALAAPAPESPLAVSEAERVEVLAFRGDGRCFLRVGDALALSDCPPTDLLETLADYRSEWWLELDLPGGKGWLSADDPGITILRE